MTFRGHANCASALLGQSQSCLAARQFPVCLMEAAGASTLRCALDLRRSNKLEVGEKVDRNRGCYATLLIKRGFLRRSGAAYVTRTRDPIITNDVLYRLS